MADDTKFYFDFHWPLKIVGFILNLLFGTNSPNPRQVDPATREWFSQPRTAADGGTEVITTTFKLPLSVSEITMEVLRMPCVAAVFYQDRSNNWRPVLDMQRIPLRVNVSRAQAKSYYKYHTRAYPIVAKQLQFRLTRTNDPALEGTPYPVGLRTCLIRRNVYNRSQGTQYFEDEVDVLGNVISKYIKDWDAAKAIDDDPHTFWKSAPQPDPAAVVSMYLDVRGADDTPKVIDKVYLDPVYTGSHLNLYYSSDDTVGTRKLSPITVRPDEDENTQWRLGRGRTDVATGINDSFYRWPLAVGPLNRQNTWIGVEWTPGFDPGDGPATNPVLLEAMAPGGPGFKPKLFYDVGAGEFVLSFDNGTDTREYSAPMTQAFILGDPLRVVAGWRYGDPDDVFISVVNRRGEEIAHLDDNPTTLPALVTFDGQLQMLNTEGTVTAHIIKLDSWTTGAVPFQTSPVYYVDPDPVIPDANGAIPATTLDNAIYAASWTTQEHGVGGAHESGYEDKEWIPVWRDYVAQKGMLFFPQALSMKYLKLEFTNLTEEPYPIYETGVEVRYKVFPVSVTQQSSIGPRLYTGEGGFLGLGTFISVNGVRTVNFLDPNSVLDAIGSVITPQIPPVQITENASFITESIPNQAAVVAEDSRRLEYASSYVYRREVLQPFVLAEDAYVTTIKAEGLQAISSFTDVPWVDIENANPGAITHVRSVGALPVRGTDWWIYPGQQLRIPANVMSKLTDTSTVTERKLTLEHRVRFNTTSIHRYEYKTLIRDASIAYFAGVREVIPFTSTFISGEDKPYFDFPSYDPSLFVTENTRRLESGPTTTLRKLYPIPNRLFERNIELWIPNTPTSAWSWDPTVGRWLRGTARCVSQGVQHTLASTQLSVAEGEQIDLSVSVRWVGLVADNNDVAVRWGVRYYGSAGELVDDDVLDEISYANWAANANSADTVEVGDNEGGWIDLTGTTTVVADADTFRVFLEVTNQVSSGTVWFESVQAQEHAPATATVFKSLTTMSSFAKVAVDFRDSGLWRGDSMWADINPDSQSIDDTRLAYYTRTIPETIPGGTWGDTVKAWAGEDVEWGSPFGVVSVTVDGNRRYQGKRVLHFRRAGGVGEAGIKVKQWTHFIPLGLFRIGAVFYKPVANDNELKVRLRRLADGEVIYEQTILPPVGRWFEFQTRFVEIPDDVNQEYEVMLTLDGDDEDELYLSDLYTEIANIRYFVKLGGIGAFLHEVTDLRYTDGRAFVTTTTPVTEVSVQAAIMSPEAWAYGCRVTPTYLK